MIFDIELFVGYCHLHPLPLFSPHLLCTQSNTHAQKFTSLNLELLVLVPSNVIIYYLHKVIHFCSSPFITTPLKSLLSLISWASGAILMANKRSNRRHPCLHPRFCVNLSDLQPLTLTEACGHEKTVSIQLMKFGPDLNLFHFWSRYCQDTLSNAL